MLCAASLNVFHGISQAPMRIARIEDGGRGEGQQVGLGFDQHPASIAEYIRNTYIWTYDCVYVRQ